MEYKIIILQANQFNYENAIDLAKMLESETQGIKFIPLVANQEDVIKIIDINEK